MNQDERYMRIAINLAKKAEGETNPNPIVGAVIVKNGHIVGQGYHKKAGLPHAEANALGRAGTLAKGATLYVSLEPCGHFGRTPPCTEAIIKSGIKKVVVGMKDPNPINNGRGIKRLTRRGIETKVGVLEEEARSINKPYIKFITKRMPYITVKAAQSLDGKIATRTGDSRWISGEDSRRYVHELRRKVDAVMVGANTVLKDNPLLLANLSKERQPIRVIVDNRLNIPLDAKLFSNVHRSPVIIATARKSARIKRYEKVGAEVLTVKPKKAKVDLKELLKILGRRGIAHILVEGGGGLIAALAEEKLIDRFLFFIAPKIIGGKDAVTSVEGRGVDRIREAPILKNMKLRKFKDDILIEAEA